MPAQRNFFPPSLYPSLRLYRGGANLTEKKVRWKVGSFELQVEGDDAFITSQLNRFFELLEKRRETTDLTSAVQLRTSPEVAEAGVRQAKELSPAEYIRQKRPETGTEQLVVLAKYLEDNRDKHEYGKKDINELAREAKIKDIHSQYFTYAVQQGVLRVVGNGKYAITLSGEDLVLRLPKGAKTEA